MATFSIIIATHDRPALLRRAIDSVKAQTDCSAEIIVVSDNSDSASYELAGLSLKDNDIFVQRFGKTGPAISRNIGMSLSSGDYLIFLDDDDTLSASYLHSATPYLDEESVLYTDYINMKEHFDNTEYVPLDIQLHCLKDHNPGSLYIKNFIPFASIIYPKKAIKGRFFDSSIGYEDWDFLLNTMSNFSLRYIPITGQIVHTRLGESSRGNQNADHLENIYRSVYKRWPAPTLSQKLSRQGLFQSIGLNAEISEL